MTARAFDAPGQLRRIPAQQRDALAAGEPIGHAGHIGDGGAHGGGAAGVEPGRSLVGQEVRPIGIPLDQRLQEIDHGAGLGLRCGPEIDGFVVELAEGGQRFGFRGEHADPAVLGGGVDHAADERAQLARPARSAALPHDFGQHRRGDDAGGHGVLEIVADVGDPVGPGDDLAFRGGRGRA